MRTQWFLEFQRIIREEADSYVKEAALFCSYQFIRASDLDSLLADFHITYKMFSNVKNLLNSDKLFKKLIDFLNEDKYIEAKLVCAWHLEYVEFDHTYKIIYFYGSLHDCCLLFQNLVCAEWPYSQTIPNSSTFNYDIFRIFELQFLLLGKEEHMTMCFRSFKNVWLYYDNDQAKPPFQLFSFEKIKDDIRMAGYVNISQAQEYKRTNDFFNRSFGYPGTSSELQRLISEDADSIIKGDASFRLYQFKRTQLQLLITNPFPYIKDYGISDLCPFTNTCVPDSFLAAFHTASLKYPNIAALLNSNAFLSDVMSLLNKRMYNKARKRFLQELNPGTDDLHSNVKDYFPLIAELVCGEITYKQKPPSNCVIYKEIPRELTKYGDVKVLVGSSLILVHRDVFNDLYRDCKSTELPPQVIDEKKRIFVLQFLLLGKEKHMTMCFQSDGNKWHLYDNDPKLPSFRPFDFQSRKNYVTCFAGYVNKPQEQECKFGIAETGTRARVFHSGTSSFIHADPRRQSVEDMEVEVPLSYPIPETGEGLGPVRFSTQESQVEDIEMVSCSSSDSD